jgi:hypothetical protein
MSRIMLTAWVASSAASRALRPSQGAFPAWAVWQKNSIFMPRVAAVLTSAFPAAAGGMPGEAGRQRCKTRLARAR